MNRVLLQNSLLVGAFTTVLALGAGFAVAVWGLGLGARGRRWLVGLAVVALMLPPFLVTNTWLHLLGLNGVWRAWLPLEIYSLGGTVWILTLLLWPITTLLSLAAWRRLEAEQLESDPALTGLALLRWLLWPMARTAVGWAGVLTFVLALNNFAVPAILQVKVLPAEVWLRFNTNFDVRGALAASWPLMLAPLALLVAWRRVEVRWPRRKGEPPAQALRRQLGRGLLRACRGFAVALLALAVGLPLLELAGSPRTWAELPKVLLAVPGVIVNSFVFAAAAATLVVGVGMATWRTRAGWFGWLTFLVPGVLLGIGLILVFNRPVLEVVYRTAAIVIVAWTIRYLAIGWTGVGRAMRGVDRDLADAARLDGASGWALWRHAYWPQVAPPLAAAWVITYLLCLWDVETLVLIVPPGGETLALRIFNLLHYGHTAQVNALCVVLLGLAVVPLGVAALARWRTAGKDQ